MFITIVLQCVSVLVAGLIAAALAGGSSALSLALGGAAAIIPNSLFAMRLAMHRGRSPESYPAVFFLGEFAKIGLTICLLAVVMRWAHGLRWLPLMIGLIVALQAPLFAGVFLRERRDGKGRGAAPERNDPADRSHATDG